MSTRDGTRGPGFRLRAAGPADGASILAINREGAPGVGLLDMREVERFLEISPFFRVAERAGAVEGYLIAVASDTGYDGEEFLWFRSRYPEFVYVDQVAVSSRARGQGAASALYADLVRFAADRGAPLLTLEVNLRPENRPSLLFHERQGFSEAGRIETADGRLVSLRTRRVVPAV